MGTVCVFIWNYYTFTPLRNVDIIPIRKKSSSNADFFNNQATTKQNISLNKAISQRDRLSSNNSTKNEFFKKKI